MRTGLIYMYTNKLNGKKYVGQTITSLKDRDNKHFHDKNNSYFDRAYKKYGRDNFKLEVLEENIPLDKLNEMEEKWIREYNTIFTSGNGYNMTKGGQSCGPIKKTTFEQESEIKKLLKESTLNSCEIADIVGSTKHIVRDINRGKLFYDSSIDYPIRRGKKKMVITDDMADKIMDEILSSNKPLHIIAEENGVKYWTINRINQGKCTRYIKEGVSYPLRKEEQNSTYSNKINGEQVKEICRDMIFGNLTHKQIGEKYGIAKNTVSDISRGLTWTKVTNGLKYPISENKKDNAELIDKIMV